MCLGRKSEGKNLCLFFVRAVDIVTLSSYLVHVKIILSDINVNLKSVERLV